MISLLHNFNFFSDWSGLSYMRFVAVTFLFLSLIYSPMISANDEPIDMIDVNALSVETAIGLALMNNPDIQSFAKNIDLAVEDIDFAKAGYRPNVDVVAYVTHRQNENNATDDWKGNTQKSLSLNAQQPLYRGGQTQADVNQNKTLLKATSHDFESLIQNKTLDIVQAYMATYTAEEGKKVAQDNVTLLNNQLEATQARFDAGELTKTDVAQADARLAEAQAQFAEFEAIYEVALSSFREVTGIKRDIDLFYPEIDMTDIPQTLDDAIVAGVNNHPLLMAEQARLRAQGYNIQEQKGALYPQLNLNAGADYTRDPFSGDQIDRQQSMSVGVAATIPLYESGRLRNQIRQAKILSAQAMDEVESARRAVTDDVISAWQEYKALKVQVIARESQLNAAKLAYQGVELEEEVGARSVLDVLDANQELRDAELALIEVQGDRVNAYYRLLAAMGGLYNLSWDKL